MVEDLVVKMQPHWEEMSLLEGAHIKLPGRGVVQFFFCTDCGEPLELPIDVFTSMVDSLLILLDHRGKYRFLIDTSTLSTECPGVYGVLREVAVNSLKGNWDLNMSSYLVEERMLYLTWIAKAAVRMDLFDGDT